MRWPWKRKVPNDQLVLSWSDQTLAYVLARAQPEGTFKVLKLGVERQGSDSLDDFVRRLQALGLKGLSARIMLRPEQYQLLQIESPAVPPEELRAAARYQIRDMIKSHLDDVTIDVMRVGDEAPKLKGHLFVVAATNALLRSLHELGDEMNWSISVIDIEEAAQRNLQSALAAADAQPDRANAALVLVEGAQAMLTICANEELFYSRCFELPDGFLTASWGADEAAAAPAVAVEPSSNVYVPVEDYVPDFSAGNGSRSHDYSNHAMQASSSSSDANQGAGDERGQRFLVEVQRSLDVWDRTWSGKPLNVVRVYAGARSQELAQWLAAHIGHRVLALDVNALFTGLETATPAEQAACLPLLGELLRELLRVDGRKP